MSNDAIPQHRITIGRTCVGKSSIRATSNIFAISPAKRSASSARRTGKPQGRSAGVKGRVYATNHSITKRTTPKKS